MSSSQLFQAYTAPQQPDCWRVGSHSWFMNQTGPSGDQTGRTDALFRSAMDAEYSNWRNFAVSGARLSSSGRSLGGWTRMMQNILPPSPRVAPYAPDGGGSVLCWGINDLGIFGGQLTNVQQTIADCYRAVISRCRASTIFEDTSSVFAYGAGWTVNASGVDLSSGTSTRQCTTTTAATITMTLPTDYAGETICFAFLKGSDNTGGTITFSGTAGVTGTWLNSGGTPGAFLNFAYNCKRITGLTAANAGQTIILTATSFDSSGALYFDCAWFEALTPPPVLIVNIARPTDAFMTANCTTGQVYAAWTGTNATRDANVQAVNALVAGVAAEFDGMVQIADADTVLNKTVLLFSDGLHPNEYGAGKVVDQLVMARNRLTPPGSASAVTLSFNPPAPRAAYQRAPRIVTRTATSEFRTTTTYTPAVGDFWAIPYLITESRDQYSTMGITVTTAGSTAGSVWLGVYDDVTWSGYPQQLPSGANANTAVLSTTATTGFKSTAFTFTFIPDPGLYWLAIKWDTIGTGQVFSGITGPNPFMPNGTTTGAPATPIGWKLTGQATGALPTSFPTGAVENDNAPAVMILKSK